MNLRNVEFDFKATKGSDYKRYSQGRKQVSLAMAALDTNDDDYVSKVNAILDDFFCGLLGEDYDQRLDIDADDLDDLLSLMDDFNKAAAPDSLQRLAVLQAEPTADPQNVQSSMPAPPMNRAQRRAARRAKA